MEPLGPTDLKTILHSKRANLYYLEHCRVLVNGGRVEYVTDQGKQSAYWNIPIANTTTVLLGTGTSVTQAGLDTLRKLARKSARKNTAVACHWIRGLDHSEPLWIVGDARRFNAEGAVPTNTTARDVLRSSDESDWLTAHDIRLLATSAALLHDLGKASIAFQDCPDAPRS